MHDLNHIHVDTDDIGWAVLRQVKAAGAGAGAKLGDGRARCVDERKQLVEEAHAADVGQLEAAVHRLVNQLLPDGADRVVVDAVFSVDIAFVVGIHASSVRIFDRTNIDFETPFDSQTVCQ